MHVCTYVHMCANMFLFIYLFIQSLRAFRRAWDELSWSVGRLIGSTQAWSLLGPYALNDPSEIGPGTSQNGVPGPISGGSLTAYGPKRDQACVEMHFAKDDRRFLKKNPEKLLF